MVRYAQNEWERKLRIEEEEMILLFPLHPVYKRLLSTPYDEEKIMDALSERFEAYVSKGETSLYGNPEEEIFLLLFPLVSVCGKGGYSREAKFVTDWICDVVSKRLEAALRNPALFPYIREALRDIIEVERMYDEAFLHKRRQGRFEAIHERREGTPDMPQEDMYRLLASPDLEPTSINYLVKWWQLADVFRTQDMTDMYIVSGWTPISASRLIVLYRELLRERLRRYVEEKKAEHEEKGIELPGIFGKIGFLVSTRVPDAKMEEVVSERMTEDAFPPCVRIALEGVGSGLRNYAITVFLTSFLSYARLFPSFSIFNRDKKLALGEKEIGILVDEILPQILEAGNRCRPPLFEENEIERLNVFYHLGFGLTDKPTPQDFGKSKWYIPPNCEKIRQNAPPLCQPDSFCLSIFYAVSDQGKFGRLHETGANRSSEMAILLSFLRKYKSIEALQDKTGIERSRIEGVLEGLVASKILSRRRIWNPFIYYLRKKIQMKRR